MASRPPIDDLPIPATMLTDVVEEHDISTAELALALVSVHESLATGADAIRKHYDDEENPEPLTSPDDLLSVLFVSPEHWNQVRATLSATEETAVKAVHAAYARELGADEDTLDSRVPLIVPSAAVGDLIRAGLSRRQAEVQVLRSQGNSHAEIADTLGMAVSTVRVHVHRIEQKVEQATKLLELVEE